MTDAPTYEQNVIEQGFKSLEETVDIDVARIALERLEEALKGNNDPTVRYNLGLLRNALKTPRKSRKPKK